MGPGNKASYCVIALSPGSHKSLRTKLVTVWPRTHSTRVTTVNRSIDIQMSVCAKQTVELHRESVDNLHQVVDANVKVRLLLVLFLPWPSWLQCWRLQAIKTGAREGLGMRLEYCMCNHQLLSQYA